MREIESVFLNVIFSAPLMEGEGTVSYSALRAAGENGEGGGGDEEGRENIGKRSLLSIY